MHAEMSESDLGRNMERASAVSLGQVSIGRTPPDARSDIARTCGLGLPSKRSRKLNVAENNRVALISGR